MSFSKDAVIILSEEGRYYTLAAGLAMWLLLPTFFNLMDGKVGFANRTPDGPANFPFKDYWQSFAPGKYTSITNTGLPALYCGMLIGVLVAGFFFLRKVSWKKKLWTASFFIVMLGGFYLTKVDLFWHMFKAPNWFPHRYAFVFGFFAVFVACDAFVLIMSMVDSRNAKKVKSNGKRAKQNERGIKPDYKWRKSLSLMIPACMLLLVCCDMFYNAKALLDGLNRQFPYKDAAEYSNFMDSTLPLIKSIQKNDASFYRMEKTYQRTLNDPLSLNYKGMSTYSSTFNKNLIRFLASLGYRINPDWFHISYMNATPAMDSVFNIKYILSQTELPAEYKIIATDKDIMAYENPNALPIGFLIDQGAADFNMDSQNCFENQTNFLNRLSGGQNEYYREVEGLIKDNDEMAYRFTASNRFPVYLQIPVTKKTGGDLYVNGRFVETYFKGDNHRIAYLGHFEPGTKVEIVFEGADRNALGILGEYICYLNMDELSRTAAKLENGGLFDISYKNSHIRGKVDAEKDGLMFTSIPYDRGFTVKVDGKKVKPERMNNTFMTFPVDAGRHDVEISFIPYGFIAGLCVSLVSMALIVFHILLYNRHGRNFLPYHKIE